MKNILKLLGRPVKLYFFEKPQSYSPCFREGHSYNGTPCGAVWSWHCATSRKVTGSIPDGVIGIFFYIIVPAAIWPLGSTQLLTEMSTRNLSWEVKAAGALG